MIYISYVIDVWCIHSHVSDASTHTLSTEIHSLPCKSDETQNSDVKSLLQEQWNLPELWGEIASAVQIVKDLSANQ